jgi:hypothetical protein
MTPINPFIDSHIPDMLWPALIAEFGRQVDYLPGGDAGQLVTITILWLEGQTDEEVSPGRYSHIKVRNSDLPVAPSAGDQVQSGGSTFGVVRVFAAPYFFSRLVLQELGA